MIQYRKFKTVFLLSVYFLLIIKSEIYKLRRN